LCSTKVAEASVQTLVRGFRKARGSLLVETIRHQADELAQIIEGLQVQKGRLEARLKPNIITDKEIAASADNPCKDAPAISSED
jgi:hypothetical protein